MEVTLFPCENDGTDVCTDRKLFDLKHTDFCLRVKIGVIRTFSLTV